MSVSINRPVNDLLQSVERPVVFGVIRRLQELTLIPHDTLVRYYGEDAAAPQYNSTLSRDPEADNRWPHRESIAIEVEEGPDPNNMLTMAVKQPEQKFFFWDEELGVILRPAYSSTTVTVRVQYKAVDKNQATKWYNEIRTRYAMMREVFLHEINYSYHVPDEFLVILKEIHRLRENIAPYGEIFTDYLTKHLTNRATEVSNLNGQDSFLAIAEKQAYVQGTFDFEAVPDKPTRDDEPNLWVTSFSYTFRYDKPIEVVMNYPIIVHQQMLSTKYRPDEVPFTYQSILKRFSYSMEKLAAFAADNVKLRHISNAGLSLPASDYNFVPRSYPRGTVKAFTALCAMDPADPRDLMNLHKLGEFHLYQDLLDFMVGEAPYMTQQYQSVFQLNHYVDGRIQDQSGLACDASLNVRLVDAADLRKTYRLRLGLVVNFTYLREAALQRLAAHPAAAIRVCCAINAGIRTLSNQKDVRKSRLSDEDLATLGLIYDADGCIVSGYGGVHRDSNRLLDFGIVETLFIIASRQEVDHATGL